MLSLWLQSGEKGFLDLAEPSSKAAWSNAPVKVLLSNLGVALVYAAAAIAGLQHAVVGSTVTLIWAPSGISLAAIFLLGYRVAPGVAVGAFAANAWTDVPLGVAAGIAAGNTMEAVAGVWLLTRLVCFRSALDRRRDVFAFIALAAAASTTLSAVVGVFALSLGNLVPINDLPGAWIKWWLGDMMGVLVVAPALLVWSGCKKIPGISIAMALETAVLAAALLSVSYLIFGAPELSGRGYYPAALAVFPFVVWGALRFGQWGASLLTLTVSMLAVWGTTQGTGPFVVDGPVDSLVRWCAFAIVVAVTGLLLAASVAEQHRAHADLERQVREQTSGLQAANTELLREMTERRKLESELIGVSEVQQQAMGRELHDGLGQHLTSLALLGAALQQRLQERSAPEAEMAARIVNVANEANAMTRAFARGLYPVAFEFGGLSAALQRLAEQTQTAGSIQCDFRCDPDVSSHDSMTALNLYRIAQEAVNNALKYSRANLILIELSQMGEQYRLCVSDDGIGIDLDQPIHQHGLGMHSMRYRARLLGGTITIEPQLSGGTRIVATASSLRNTT